MSAIEAITPLLYKKVVPDWWALLGGQRLFTLGQYCMQHCITLSAKIKLRVWSVIVVVLTWHLLMS